MNGIATSPRFQRPDAAQSGLRQRRPPAPQRCRLRGHGQCRPPRDLRGRRRPQQRLRPAHAASSVRQTSRPAPGADIATGPASHIATQGADMATGPFGGKRFRRSKRGGNSQGGYGVGRRRGADGPGADMVTRGQTWRPALGGEAISPVKAGGGNSQGVRRRTKERGGRREGGAREFCAPRRWAICYGGGDDPAVGAELGAVRRAQHV